MNKSLGEVFRSAWRAATHNFKTLFVAILIYTVPTAVLGLISSMMPMYMQLEGGATAISLCILLYTVLIAPLFMGFITSVLRTYHLTGTQVEFKTAWGAAKANYGRCMATFWATVLIAFVFAIVLAVIIVVVVMGALQSTFYFSGPAAYTVFGAILPAIAVMIVVALFFSFCLSFVQFIPGMEFPSGFAAIFKSFRYIFKGNFWKNLGHVLLIGLITTAIEVLIMLPFYAPFFSMLATMPPSALSYATSMQMFLVPLHTIISMVVGLFIQVFTTPYMFEVYLNAKAVSDGKDSQGMQNAYTDPYAGFTQNNASPYGGQNPPQIPPDERR